MLRTQADTPSDEADVGRVDRTPLNAAIQCIGWLYGTLNQVAPLGCTPWYASS